MDLSFITDGFFGHLSYILLIISSLMRRMLWLRLFVMGSALAGIVFDYVMIGNVVGAFWQALLFVVNVVQIVLLWTRDRRARFSDEEKALMAACLHTGSPGNKRLLLDMGRWEWLEPGAVLAQEGQRPRFLTFLTEGRVRIEHGGEVVAHASGGQFIGEMSLMGDGLASSDAVVAAQSRAWQIERNKLDRMKVNQPELFALVEGAITLNLREKVLHGNLAAASARRSTKEA